MRSLTCRCGKEFTTNAPYKKYCGSVCQIKFSAADHWIKVKLDYKRRCCVLCHMAKNRAKTGSLAFDLDKEHLINLWEEQDGRCAISGRLFDLARPSEIESVKANAPSLDRIEPKKGYVKGNVRLVCYQVNTALNEYGEAALRSLCKDIIANEIVR